MMFTEGRNNGYRWQPVESDDELVLRRNDGEAHIPAQYALALLVDHYGAEKVLEMVRELGTR